MYDEALARIIGCIENSIYRTHQEREERKAKELKSDGKDVLLRCLTCIVTIAHGSDDLENPIESKNIPCGYWLLVETFSINP